MNFRKLFPFILGGALAFGLSLSAVAQSSEADPRQTSTTIEANGAKRLETELTVPVVEDGRPRSVRPSAVSSAADTQLITAIKSHLGATYYFTGTGPNSFDCSGFVWRSFQEAGINFTRGPARSYWATMPVPPKEEQFKFGTIVFFSGQTHVGIVADEKGFYHSSRHHGVVYSPFNDYWLSRIDGFRRAPVNPMPSPNAKMKAPVKTATPALTVDEDNQP